MWNLQALLVLWCTEPYQTARLPGALLLRNLLRRYKEQPAGSSAHGSDGSAAPNDGGATPTATTYDEVIGEMAAGAAQREDPPAALAHGGQYSGWVYTAPASKYDVAEVRWRRSPRCVSTQNLCMFCLRLQPLTNEQQSVDDEVEVSTPMIQL